MAGEFAHGDLVRVAEVDRPVAVAGHQPQQAFDGVVDEAEAARLQAAAIERDVLAASACTMKLLTTRPSSGSMRGP
jgi:hypothetical protein